MPFAARITDQTADGIITGAGVPNVLVGGMPASVVGDIATPSSGNIPLPFAVGSTTVLIGGKPAIRQGDTALNGSAVVMGCTSVIIG